MASIGSTPGTCLAITRLLFDRGVSQLGGCYYRRMASNIPRELTDYHLDRIADAYHATVEALLRGDPEWIAEGLSMLSDRVRDASHEIGEHLMFLE